MTDQRLRLGNGAREPHLGDQTSLGTSTDANRGSVRRRDCPHDRETEPCALAARAAIAVEPLEGFE
jgi:hypothetical protein